MTSADIGRSAVAMETALRATRYADVGARVLFAVTLVTGTLVGRCAVSVQTAARTGRNTAVMSRIGISGLHAKNTDYSLKVQRSHAHSHVCI